MLRNVKNNLTTLTMLLNHPPNHFHSAKAWTSVFIGRSEHCRNTFETCSNYKIKNIVRLTWWKTDASSWPMTEKTNGTNNNARKSDLLICLCLKFFIELRVKGSATNQHIQSWQGFKDTCGTSSFPPFEPRIFIFNDV